MPTLTEKLAVAGLPKAVKILLYPVFKEKGQPFWKTKQTFVELPHPDISISDGVNELTEIPLQSNLMLNVGVLIHFKY